jgi:hypothetical protein
MAAVIQNAILLQNKMEKEKNEVSQTALNCQCD